jgi:hypothetical protein
MLEYRTQHKERIKIRNKLLETANEMTVNGYYPVRHWQRGRAKRMGQRTNSIDLHNGLFGQPRSPWETTVNM